MTARLLPRPAPDDPDGPSGGEASFPPGPDGGPAFERRDPVRRAGALVAASPHSGRLYPAEMMQASALDRRAIRSSEDVWVDRLVEGAPGHGVPLLLARHARAYVDLNRAPYELDPAMFAQAPPRPCTRTARAAAGLGSVARVVAEGAEIYRAPLPFAEAEARLERVHTPYHAELARMMDAAAAACGCAVLLDWHSMPAAAVRTGGAAGPEIVLGDRHGAGAGRAVVRRVEAELERAGWRTARNLPYAGGYVLERHGRPAERRHAVQVEIRRDLYLDEATLQPSAGFARLRARLDAALARLAAVDWTALA